MDTATDTSKTLERRQNILTAALDVFGSYGFRRTSMDDIAKAAGISRPALYQSFANKKDIFRALISDHMEMVCAAMQEALEAPSNLTDCLDQLFDISILQPHRMLEAMPHGEELLGLKADFAEDIFDDWMQRCHRAYEAAFLQDKSIKPELASDLAAMLNHAIAGLKASNSSVHEFETEFLRLKRVISSSISQG